MNYLDNALLGVHGLYKLLSRGVWLEYVPYIIIYMVYIHFTCIYTCSVIVYTCHFFFIFLKNDASMNVEITELYYFTILFLFCFSYPSF